MQRTIQVPHPVTGTQTVQQLVQTEIPLATGFSQAIGLPSAPMTAVASISPSVTSAASTNQQPLLGRFPLLAGRPTWQSPAWQGQTWENANWQSAWPTIPAPTGRWVASNGATGSTNASPQLIASNVSGSSPSGPVASTPLGGYSSGGSSSQSSIANKNSGLRPVARAMQNILPPAYNAPMQSASRASGSWDVMQSGLRPTVLR